MSTVRELHTHAMRYAHLALVAREQGRLGEAVDCAREAYTYEQKALNTLVDGPRIEPTRSILYQSAASLAYQAHMFAEAERLIILGLNGTPPPYVKEQLYHLLTSVRFQQRLNQEDFMSEKTNSFHISLFGNAVGFGTIWYDEFQNRMASVLEIVERNIQRHSHRIYQRGGAIKDRPFIPVLQPIQEGNVIVTIQLVPSDTVAKPMFISPEQAISDLMIGVKYINESNMEALEELISDDTYRQNFVANAKRIAPDGDRITLVGLSYEDSTVSFTRPSQEILLDSTKPSMAMEETNEFQYVEITGTLDMASQKKSSIILTDDTGKEHSIQIGEGLDSYVRSFFGYRVVITGTSDGKSIRLINLQQVLK